MSHSGPDTTQQYTVEVELDDLADALDRAASTRDAQASPDLTTLDTELANSLEDLEWRRRVRLVRISLSGARLTRAASQMRPPRR